MSIPLVDLAWQHAQVAEALVPRLVAAMEAGHFIGGDEVEAFEDEFASYCGARHCVGVANGTDAIELALMAVGIGPGDDVVVPANTFIATVEGVLACGARPVFVDADEHHLIDVGAAATAVATGARAVLPVHLYGQPSPTQELVIATSAHAPLIIEDAAQSQGARIGDRSIGAHATAATTSFYPGKNLGAYGDAGAVVTDDPALADRLRLLANHGSRERYVHEVVGRNSRLDALQAIVLREKLRHLDNWNEQRRQAAARYHDLLADLPVGLPATLAGHDHVWHLYVIEVEDRDAVLGRLNQAGIGAAIHYPTPAHLHEATRHLGHAPGDFPVAERLATRILSLPIYPGLTEAQQATVVQELRTAVA